MNTITGYRTKLITAEQAERFARCLSANAQYQGVAVRESNQTRSRTRRYFVEYSPVAEGRTARLLHQAQDSRAQRADEQADNYLFDHQGYGRFFECINLTTGEVYQTTANTCDCPDAHYRLRGTGVLCKHSLALRSRLTERETQLR